MYGVVTFMNKKRLVGIASQKITFNALLLSLTHIIVHFLFAAICESYQQSQTP
jgi:hypothetical protein